MNFDQLNETDVREEIIAPWLRCLGYRTGTEHNIRRELSLRYEKLSLGRKKIDRDPVLRGKADYVLEAGGRVRWILEAKPPSSDMGLDEVEQSWSYANHPEVRAVYHCLCNGRRFDVYRTNSGPEHPTLLSLSYEELTHKSGWSQLERVLGPMAVLRDNPEVVLDLAEPLCIGLRSFAQIVGGKIHYQDSSIKVPALTQMVMSAIGGTIQRKSGGGIVVTVQTRAPTYDLQSLLERRELTSFTIMCGDETISTDISHPSVFSFQGQVFFPTGEAMPNISTWESHKLPAPVRADVNFTAHLIVQAGRMVGPVQVETIYNGVVTAKANGQIELWLA